MLVLRGGWGGSQGGINGRALLHGHAKRLEMGFEGLNNSLFKFVFLQQVAEDQICRLIWDQLTHDVGPSEPSHDRQLDQGVFRGWITQGIPLLHQVDAAHGRQRIGRPTCFRVCLG